jgi:hypothetical protein
VRSIVNVRLAALNQCCEVFVSTNRQLHIRQEQEEQCPKLIRLGCLLVIKMDHYAAIANTNSIWLAVNPVSGCVDAIFHIDSF